MDGLVHGNKYQNVSHWTLVVKKLLQLLVLEEAGGHGSIKLRGCIKDVVVIV